MWTEKHRPKVIGEIIFSDLDLDSVPEIIAVNDIGEVHVLHSDGDYYQNFPIDYQFPFSSAPLVYDIDGDNDLEIIAGTTNAIISIDIKEDGSFRLNDKFFNYSTGLTMTNESFSDLFGTEPRKNGSNIHQIYMDHLQQRRDEELLRHYSAASMRVVV